MANKKPRTLGELKKRVTRLPSLREEMRANLIKKLENRERLFPTLIGYDDSVLPGMVNAILCGHNIIILGERGQGKSRIVRSMVDFLDEEIPVVEGCPIHDNPFEPICTDCKSKLAQMGDDLPVSYVARDRRLVEKLATSDVSTADLIGEVDPIKVARGKTLDDESTVHFGLVPRANRSIFAINELPDLAEKIQVAFFNIMEENDFQIKGFPVRLPLDILIVATANPEDYTNRGRIITPLKDRFDVQLRTHFPKKRAHEIEIMEQEARPLSFSDVEVRIPKFIKEIISELTFQARQSPEINQHSGVSCRVSIRGYEAIVGSAFRRCLTVGEKIAVPRISDVKFIYPAITGKVELEYEAADSNEGELVDDLAKRAIKSVFDEHFQVEELEPLVESFNSGIGAEVSAVLPSSEYMDIYERITGMKQAVATIVDTDDPGEVSSAVEFVLDGLFLSNKLNREEKGEGLIYK
ncbi:MAG: AAA domain-containing protein [Proteobacteria bacterium]|nr:AAA domain-containing protein [Pseudomonadota bacterium]